MNEGENLGWPSVLVHSSWLISSGTALLVGGLSTPSGWIEQFTILVSTKVRCLGLRAHFRTALIEVFFQNLLRLISRSFDLLHFVLQDWKHVLCAGHKHLLVGPAELLSLRFH